MPELKPLIQSPPGMAGFLNYHGKIVPVINLEVALGFPERPYTLKEYLVLLKVENLLFGVVISELLGVNKLEKESRENFQNLPCEKKEGVGVTISFVGLCEGEIVFVIDPFPWKDHLNELSQLSCHENVFMNMAPMDKPIFAERAVQMNKVYDANAKQDLINLIIIQYKNEYYGVDLEMVKEFCNYVHFTPISMAAPHILGFMNLRGSVLTLIDIWKILGLPEIEIKETTKALVVNLENFLTGLVVDEIIGIFQFSKNEFKVNPVMANEVQDQFIKNSIHFQNNVLGVLDLKKIFESIAAVETEDS